MAAFGGKDAVYDDGKRKLDTAILEYDQAISDLTAWVVSSKSTYGIIDLLGIKSEMVHTQNAEFLDWLSPSYLKVEGRFSLLRKQRNDDTLKWARNMPEFQNWQRSESNSGDRLLWICATLGVGKSVMASYFVELLKCGYPEAFVGYFFCRSGEKGLTKAGEIIRTLAYQFVISNSEEQKELDSSRMHGKIDPTAGVVFLFERLLEGILTRTKGKVFIVLDGLDEADCNDVDTTSVPARSEIQIFLQYASANCLFMCFSSADPISSR